MYDSVLIYSASGFASHELIRRICAKEIKYIHVATKITNSDFMACDCMRWKPGEYLFYSKEFFVGETDLLNTLACKTYVLSE